MLAVLRTVLLITIITAGLSAYGQDGRTQYPHLLSRCFFSVNAGAIYYSFSNEQLEPGFTTTAVETPHTAVRLGLFGYRFNKVLSAQVTYMRPVNWVRYKNINDTVYNAPVFTNLGAVTLRARVPVSPRISITPEAGYALVSRSGISLNDSLVVMKALVRSALLLGVSVGYDVTDKWTLQGTAVFSPAQKPVRQPATVFVSGGFVYNLQPLPQAKVQTNAASGYLFPHHTLQVGYTTGALGYGLNHFLAEGKIPVFWGGKSVVANGATIHYRQNVFHTAKLFSLDWGVNAAAYTSVKNKENFFTLALYPLFRFTPIRTRPLDVYFYYSIAGPCYISKINMDDTKTGEKFTFQDLMGAGAFFGKNRQWGAEAYIGHYSNGNIFPYNEGVKVPLTFNLLYNW